MQGRAESPEFFTDFSIDWGGKNSDEPLFRLMFIDHGHKLPYVVWSLCEIRGNPKARTDFFADLEKGHRDSHIRDLLRTLVEHFKEKPLTERIIDNFEKYVTWPLQGKEGREYFIFYRYRRLGIDTGFDTLVHLDMNVEKALKHYENTTKGVVP